MKINHFRGELTDILAKKQPLLETAEHGITALKRPIFCVWSPSLSTVRVTHKARATTPVTPHSHTISKTLHTSDSSSMCDGSVISLSPCA